MSLYYNNLTSSLFMFMVYCLLDILGGQRNLDEFIIIKGGNGVPLRVTCLELSCVCWGGGGGGVYIDS